MGLNKMELFTPVIAKFAQKFNIDFTLLLAFCRVESNFIPTAIRWEPRFYHRYIAPKVAKGEIPFEEAIGNACSFGLMQIMGSTARRMGYEKDFTGLWQPIINLNYCCKYLNKLIKRYDRINDAIAAYNAGSARFTEESKYVNQKYVDKINYHWEKYERELTDNGTTDTDEEGEPSSKGDAEGEGEIPAS